VIAVLAALLAIASPGRLQVTTARGTVNVPLVEWRGDGPLVPLSALARAIGAAVHTSPPWAVLETGGGEFRFLLGTPIVQDGSTLVTLPATAHQRHDSLFVPLAFVSEVLAAPARQAWHWLPATAVLAEGPAATPLTLRPSRTTVGAAKRSQLPYGLKAGHRVTIDAGHGGTDPGNPGMFFPHGLKEKDVTLAVSLLVRDDLEKQGVRVTMTRTTDTLINLTQRAPRYCSVGCDLFVSIHVNSLNPRPGYTNVHGFETYFLAEARSADAARVARLENDAARFDRPEVDSTPTTGLDFMFKDLQSGEYLRQSQRAAALIQELLGEMRDTPTSGGVKQAGFAVLTTAKRPAVLIEIGFATNRDDAKMMTTPSGQRALASNIATAIIKYLRVYDQQTADSSGPR
jgi:N-acetylmuramoyl-L-alanine amidase